MIGDNRTELSFKAFKGLRIVKGQLVPASHESEKLVKQIAPNYSPCTGRSGPFPSDTSRREMQLPLERAVRQERMMS